jgi:hypothetical protein
MMHEQFGYIEDLIHMEINGRQRKGFIIQSRECVLQTPSELSNREPRTRRSNVK